MPDQNSPCPPSGRVSYEVPLNDESGYVLVDATYTHDGVSVRPNCDGPITTLRTRNTGMSPAWALLPNKRKGDPWYRIDPGDDLSVSAKGTLNNLGLSNVQDVIGVGFQFTDPALG